MTVGWIEARAAELIAARAPFVEAVVVRAQRPTSTGAGARALILPDGTIEGFVGGTCAKESLRLHALRVLETGEPLLLRILPGTEGADAAEGSVTVANPCLSGGALEIFLEPRVPTPQLVVVGDAPIARALMELAGIVGFDPVQLVGDAAPGPLVDAAVVVASHGEAEERTLERALNDHAVYVGLVASRARGAEVLARLDVTPDARARVHTPAGLNLHARTPQESALAILSEIVGERRGAPRVEIPSSSPASAMDPVCGMEVVVSAGTVRSERGGETTFFCCEGCRERFDSEADGRAARA